MKYHMPLHAIKQKANNEIENKKRVYVLVLEGKVYNFAKVHSSYFLSILGKSSLILEKKLYFVLIFSKLKLKLFLVLENLRLSVLSDLPDSVGTEGDVGDPGQGGHGVLLGVRGEHDPV